MQQKKQENYGKGQHAISDPMADVWANPNLLTGRLRATLRAPDYRPPMLPSVALELWQLTSDPNVDVAKVRSLIQSEPMIAARVLRLAQSPFYSRGAPITSLLDAITRLGLDTLGQLFLQESMSTKVFRAKGFEKPMEELRKHSVVTGHIARLVCRRTGFPDEYAFMCGLLHDIGMAAGILILADMGGQQLPEYELVAGAVETVHEEASAILARAWKLPEDVCLVLEHHHHFKIDGRVHPLAAAICFSDFLAAELGVPAGREVRPALALAARNAINLGSQDVEAIQLAAENYVTAA